MKGVFTDGTLRLLWLFQNSTGIKGCFILLLPSKRWHVLFESVFQVEVFNVSSTVQSMLFFCCFN